jgi:hypothetical protein
MVLIRIGMERSDRFAAADRCAKRQAAKAAERVQEVALAPGAGKPRAIGEPVAKIKAELAAALGEDKMVNAFFGSAFLLVLRPFRDAIDQHAAD